MTSEDGVASNARAKRKASMKAASQENKQKKEDEQKTKKTFARRYRPSSEAGIAKWEALRAAFAAIISVRMTCPSKLEVGFFSFEQI